MSSRVKVKVHNVMHDKGDYDVSRAEEYIDGYIVGVDVVDVRVAPGPENSPIFVTLDRRSLSLEAAKGVARDAVSGFSQFVDGINEERVVRDDNIRVMVE